MMRKSLLLIACLLVLTAQANDGVYFLSGNQLVPLKETDISIAKEVLTISICDDGYANVDVQYDRRPSSLHHRLHRDDERRTAKLQ